MKAPLDDVKYLKSKPVNQNLSADQIDAEAGILYGVVMCQEGEAKGHGVFLEAEFIKAVAKYDRKFHKKSGLKARFDHPGMCDGTMGTQLGKFINFQTREAEVIDDVTKEKKTVFQLIADLQLLESSELSPTKPGMKSWVISMAQESPDFLMSSIVFTFSRYYQRNAKGKKKYIYEYEEFEDEQGQTQKRWVSYDAALGNIYLEFGPNGRHFYTDLVEAGAATDELFSSQFNTDKFGVQASEWLRDNPAIIEFIQKNPEKVEEYFSKIGILISLKKPKTLMGKFTDFLLGKTDTGAEKLDPEISTELQEAKTEYEKVVGERDAALAELAEVRNKTKEPSPEDNPEELSELDKANAELATAKAEILRLKKKPVEEHTNGETKPDEATKERAYHKTPLNVKRRALARRRAKNKEAE